MAAERAADASWLQAVRCAVLACDAVTLPPSSVSLARNTCVCTTYKSSAKAQRDPCCYTGPPTAPRQGLATSSTTNPRLPPPVRLASSRVCPARSADLFAAHLVVKSVRRAGVSPCRSRQGEPFCACMSVYVLLGCVLCVCVACVLCAILGAAGGCRCSQSRQCPLLCQHAPTASTSHHRAGRPPARPSVHTGLCAQHRVRTRLP